MFSNLDQTIWNVYGPKHNIEITEVQHRNESIYIYQNQCEKNVATSS